MATKAKSKSKAAPKAKSTVSAKAKAKNSASPPASRAAGEVMTLFREADADGNGTISAEELAALLQTLNPAFTPDQACALIEHADMNADGQLGFAEFVVWLFGGSAEGEVQLLGAISAPPVGSDAIALKGRDDTIDDDDEFEEQKVMLSNRVVEERLGNATNAALERYPDCQTQIKKYFNDLEQCIARPEFADRVTGNFAQRLDTNGDGTLSVQEVSALIRPTFSSIAEFATLTAPEDYQVDSLFSAHDTSSHGKGQMGRSEFLNLMKDLTIQVNAEMIPHLVAEWRKLVAA